MIADSQATRSRRLFITGVILIDLIAVAIAFWPVLVLGLGLQAIGDANGWWPGDPNSNDGEEVFATIVGAVGLLIVLVAAAVPVALLARRQRQPVFRSTARNTLYLLGVCLVVGILLVIF
ncbi:MULTISPECIES: hypothetical protein [unclassified Cryobacterium]|uniref:hypothetical protein n=1 Tax=unclassified Cryobacterium TaxID=2649013 RepID=UPI001069B6C5|nr:MULTISPECIES: hypothetical protein [unclassified Cryobacterium]TFC50361.1 hypothetical protein E3O68_18360 [Cryobacterium sp. TMB3-1-2]TFC71904.1 hypothetical protein E3T21_07040 [Cryobacterium sp. TMB3-15]TFC78497.1 hypothetical protein E3T22_03235 [Cryobacterium sp. TMB3-10]TFD44554.1 hypothetical protein E3T58_04295 [Cryobacterium sp. TMB3-12]